MAPHVRVPKLLRQGDLVRLVSPASTPDEDGVTRSVKLLESLGLRVGLGRHVFDKFGYLAGRHAAGKPSELLQKEINRLGL